jgi:hypothetical protein
MKKCRVVKSLSVLLFITLSACGGGSSVNDNKEGPPPVKTKAMRSTVIDGYVQFANVCVDKNNNTSCDSGETQGKTGPDGEVTLDIPVDDVGKYPIVAFVPANAIDKDDGKMVGTAYTLIAPADQSTLVSPLSTLVQHLIVVGGKTSAEAAAEIKGAIGDPRVDYIANAGSTQTRVAAKILVRLMQQLPSRMQGVSGQTDAQKTDALNAMLVKALPDLKTKAMAIANSPVCTQSITSTECQTLVLVDANTISGELIGIAAPGVPFVNLLTDTGITSAQCLAYDDSDFVDCTTTAAVSLNSKQDGMIGLDLSQPNPNDGTLGFSYGLVPKTGVVNYDRTECVKDNTTGLMWEGKPPSTNTASKRNSLNTYNYLEGDAKNVKIYVEAVNSDKLCGYGDWRLPTLTELLSLVNFSKVQDLFVENENRAIDDDWFPNTKGEYGSSDFCLCVPEGKIGAKRYYSIDFSTGSAGQISGERFEDIKIFIRLVR